MPPCYSSLAQFFLLQSCFSFLRIAPWTISTIVFVRDEAYQRSIIYYYKGAGPISLRGWADIVNNINTRTHLFINFLDVFTIARAWLTIHQVMLDLPYKLAKVLSSQRNNYKFSYYIRRLNQSIVFKLLLCMLLQFLFCKLSELLSCPLSTIP